MTFTWMRRFAVVLAMPLFLGQVVQAHDTPTLTVSGQGRVDAAPDMATITLGVTETAPEATAAMDQVSTKLAAVLARLDALGVAERDVQTRNISLGPVWSSHNSSQARRITGFQASNTLIVRIRDLGGLGAMMDAVLQDGANDFRGLSFGMADPGPHVDAARSDAVADAMRKAQLMAAAAGLRLGPVLSISEGGSGQPRPMMMEMAAARASDAMPVAPGEVSLSATVSMVFALKD